VPNDPAPAVLAAFGRAIRAHRLERGYTLERLAEEAGLHPRYVSDVERGRRNVGLINVARLARALSISLSELMRSVEGEG
jgi:transcriptional regulator with XRE-family HTH domain